MDTLMQRITTALNRPASPSVPGRLTAPTVRRDSCLFPTDQQAPKHRPYDRSAHRLYAHYYEDLLN